MDRCRAIAVGHSASGEAGITQHAIEADLPVMTRMLAALGAALAIMAAAASSTVAATPAAIQEASATAQASGDGSTATATATCPGGTKAAGGGFDVPSTNRAIGIVYESVKVHQHAWSASAQVFGPTGSGELTLTTYVYCRAHYPATHVSSQTVPTDGQVQLGPTASATCPRDEVAMAGGFHMPPPLVAPTVTDLFFDSLRDGVSSWDGRVVTGPAGPSTITSEAYCTARQDVPVEADGVSDPNGVDGLSSTAVAACPAGLTPAAGGFAQPASDLASFFFVTGSRRVGDSWQVTGLHSGFDPAVPLQAAGYCA
jgi:hypothetical protein